MAIFMRGIIVTTLAVATFSLPAIAEQATYGSVDLTGLARNDWHLNPAGESQAMVCNVNGPDGYLTVRTRASSSAPSARKLNRLAIVVVDTRERQGDWVLVVNAFRTHSKNGRRLARHKNLPVTGWAHSNYLCGFLD